MRETFEPGNTVQFTFVSSVAPNSAPTFKVTEPFSSGVTSLTAATSDTTHYYSLYTMPTSEGVYLAEWYAVKTFSGSDRAFIKRFTFNIKQTRGE